MSASEVRIQRGRERRYVGPSLWTRRGRLSDWRSETRENGYDQPSLLPQPEYEAFPRGSPNFSIPIRDRLHVARYDGLQEDAQQ